MDGQIKISLDEITNSSENDSINFMKNIKHKLNNILTVLYQQNQALRQNHKIQIDRLNSIIAEKQVQIKQLKAKVSKQKQKISVSKVQNITPYKILLKSNKSQHNILHNQSLNKDRFAAIDEAFSSIQVYSLKENRFSLQIGPSSGKRTCRISSSNIKNKILNQNNDKMKGILSPRPFIQQNSTDLINNITYKDKNTIYQEQNQQKLGIYNKQSTRSNYEHGREQYFKRISNCQQKHSQNELKTQPKICRKPSNKSKRQLFLRKKQTLNCHSSHQNLKIKCVDVKIPIKIINVAKPR